MFPQCTALTLKCTRLYFGFLLLYDSHLIRESYSEFPYIAVKKKNTHVEKRTFENTIHNSSLWFCTFFSFTDRRSLNKLLLAR